MVVTHQNASQRTLTLAKRIHRYSHAQYAEMIEILAQSERNKTGMAELCRKIIDACPVCARSGPPKHSKKVSLTHVCKEFNQEMQVDFMFADVRNSKYCVLHVVDTSTAYSETPIVSKRSADIMANRMEAWDPLQVLSR